MMRDREGRIIDYLRLSITDLCSFRCIYCMPEGGVCKRSHDDILSIEELVVIGRAAVECGITKIRLTGGEPLTRRGVVELCRQLKAIDGLRELAMTTNGALLPKLGKQLKAAGLDRVNLSLDTLRPDRFHEITRVGRLENVLQGLQAAEAAGFEGIKINAVLLGGINDDEIPELVALTRDRPISLRFIELMRMGECISWPKERFISAETVLEAVPSLKPLERKDGVSQLYAVPGWMGTVGLIRPLSTCFCDRCSRIRVTSDGKLKPCLHSAQEIPLRGLSGEALRATIERAILCKPKRHHLVDRGVSETHRDMNQIGG